MTVFKNSRGVWTVKVRINGEQIKKENSNWTKRDAQQAELDLLNTHGTDSNVTLADLNSRLLAECKLKETSVRAYMYRMHLLRSISHKPVTAITLSEFKAWQLSLRKYSASTIRYAQAYFYKLCEYGVNNELLSAVPFRNIPAIKGERKPKLTDVDFYTIDQYNALISVVDEDRDILAYRMLMFCGLRLGELTALQVKHINGDSITIEQTMGLHAKKVTSPKTTNSYRRVVMDATTAAMVAKWTEGLDPECFVMTRDYHMEEYNNFRRRHYRYVKKANLPRIRVHGLRHSHVSLLIEKGFSAHDIADRIGDTVTMVNEIYGHLYKESQQRIANSLENL